jgi:hypothetical protein
LGGTCHLHPLLATCFTLVSCMAWSSNLKVEAKCYFETSADFSTDSTALFPVTTAVRTSDPKFNNDQGVYVYISTENLTNFLKNYLMKDCLWRNVFVWRQPLRSFILTNYLRFEVHAAVCIHIEDSWHVTPCSRQDGSSGNESNLYAGCTRFESWLRHRISRFWFEVLTQVTMKCTFLWNVPRCTQILPSSGSKTRPIMQPVTRMQQPDLCPCRDFSLFSSIPPYILRDSIIN